MDEKDLIAPCGMNCGICMAYLRSKNRCMGCNSESNQKANYCATCKIRACQEKDVSKKFCFICRNFPCDKLKHLDKRYREKYQMSTIENLKNIKEMGLEEFVKMEKKRWACPTCGEPICVHNKKCYECEKALA